MTKVLISGYYGIGNMGDEAILSGIINALSEQLEAPSFSAITSDPEDTRRLHNITPVYQSFQKGIPAFLKNQVTNGEMLKVNKAIEGCDVFMLGGGEQLQDLKIHYLPILLSLVYLAQKKGKKTVIYGIGAGPIETKLGKRICRKVLGKADLVTVRDEKSKAALEGCGLTNVIKTVDPAFGIEIPDEQTLRGLRDGMGLSEDKKVISTTSHSRLYDDDLYRKTGGAGIDLDKRRKRLAESYDHIIDSSGNELLFIPTVGADAKGFKAVRKHMKLYERANIMDHRSDYRYVMASLSNSEALIGMRLHSMILAAQLGIPFTPISYSSKVRSFLDMIGLKDLYLDTEDLENEDFTERLLENYSKVKETRVTQSRNLLVHSERLRKKASESAKLVAELFD
jgi:polysaccharide pyruvyl transferase CsaB